MKELTKIERFAKNIIRLAADEGLTVYELCNAADTAKGIAECSAVDKESVEKFDYPSRHIVEYPTCGIFDSE